MPSRRLGLSLGIDLTPHKVCDFDCVYCQCGPTTVKTMQRKPYVPYRLVLAQVLRAIRDRGRIDFLTFSGSGEPTLNSGFGKLIAALKRSTRIPVCVITNGSTLYRPEVRRALRQADLVLPTLCAASQRALDRVNRPHPALRISTIIRGLAAFRREFRGQIWLEVMLVRGLNDSNRDIRNLKKAIARIKPDKVQLNTVVRPPSERTARPVPLAALKKIKKILGPKCEIVAEFSARQRLVLSAPLEKAILGIIRRRPETAAGIAASLGADRNEVLNVLHALQKRRRVKTVIHHNRVYYGTS